MAVVNDNIRIGDNFEVVILQYKYLHENGLSNEFLIDSKLSKLAEPQAMQALVEYIGNAVLVGHRIHFDIEMINDVLEKMECGKLKNEALDIEIMHQKLMDITNKSFSLEDFAYSSKTSDSSFVIKLLYKKIFLSKSILSIFKVYHV